MTEFIFISIVINYFSFSITLNIFYKFTLNYTIDFYVIIFFILTIYCNNQREKLIP